MSYFNIPTAVLENDLLKLEYLTEASLRLIRLVFKPTGLNLFAETPEVNFETGHGKYYLRGGHRLWVTPETFDLTYADETASIQIETGVNSLVLKQAGSAPYYIYKEIRVQMDPKAGRLHLVQSIRNDATKPIHCGPWGLSMMAPGGEVIVPTRPAGGEQPGLLPDRSLVLWPYTKLQDPRLEILDDSVRVHTNSNSQTFKIGLRSPQGWLAYLHQGVAFVLRSPFDKTAHYPDYGCNAEVYTNGVFVELEVLAGMAQLEPAAWLHIEEDWEIFPFAGSADDLFKKLNS
jgi:hypothetical protein